MKTNSKKIVVSTLALAMGAALAGSISGSVAWYQYSTRTTASMTATSAGTSRSLKISTEDLDVDSADWKYHLDDATIKDASDALGHNADGNLKPVSAVVDGDGKPGDFKAHPVYQYPTLPAAEGTEFLQFDLYFESLDKDGNREADLDVKLTALNITVNDTDVEKALRLAIYDEENDHYYVASKTAGTTATEGALDLNVNGVNDKDGFAADDSAGNEIEYTSGEASYDTIAWGTLVATDTDPYNITGGQVITKTESDKNAKITVVVWLEGWQEVTNVEEDVSGTEASTASIWDAELIGKTISLDMRFAVNAQK